MSSEKRKYHSNHLTEDQRIILRAYVKNNPTHTYAQFLSGIKGRVHCSDAHYYAMRRAEHGAAINPRKYSMSGARPRSPVYMTVWSCPQEKINKGSPKDILKDFITTLNAMRRTRFDIIELKEPAEIEIRESTRL
jgi:hypothetical protein